MSKPEPATNLITVDKTKEFEVTGKFGRCFKIKLITGFQIIIFDFFIKYMLY
jgi:ABC-type antimicrobial peptide transport system permease subunit